jgi:hypothetical protein
VAYFRAKKYYIRRPAEVTAAARRKSLPAASAAINDSSKINDCVSISETAIENRRTLANSTGGGEESRKLAKAGCNREAMWRSNLA